MKKYIFTYLILIVLHIIYWTVAVIVANNMTDLLLVIGLITYSIIHMIILFHKFTNYMYIHILQHIEHLTDDTIFSKWIHMRIKYTNKTPSELLDMYIKSLNNISFRTMLKRNIILSFIVFFLVLACMV